MKKPKTQKIKLVAKNPRKIKAALKAWVAASDKVDSDPMKLGRAPKWVENALFEVVKVVLPSRRKPSNGEVDLEFFGELIGRVGAFGKLFSGGIPMGAEMKADWDRLQKRAASEPQTPERTAKIKAFGKDFVARVNADNVAMTQVMAAALGSSHEDALKYQKGLLRGMNLEPDELTPGRIFQRHTRTFWVLGTQWRNFRRCRSVAEVHRILCDQYGEEKIGSLKTFENRVAGPIGMRFGRSGRPPKSK